MLFLITVPANNTRGPRYMEKSLAAMHQARLRHPVTLIYGSTDDEVGLFVRCHAADREAVLEPIVANYPYATVTLVEAGAISPVLSLQWHFCRLRDSKVSQFRREEPQFYMPHWPRASGQRFGN